MVNFWLMTLWHSDDDRPVAPGKERPRLPEDQASGAKVGTKRPLGPWDIPYGPEDDRAAMLKLEALPRSCAMV